MLLIPKKTIISLRIVSFIRCLFFWHQPQQIHCSVLHIMCPSHVGELDGLTPAPAVLLLSESHVPQLAAMATKQTDVH